MKKEFVLLLLSISLALWDINAQIGSLKPGDLFQLTGINTISGEQYSLAETENKVFVMNFWNIGCKGCEQERPYLNQLYKEYGNKEVIFWSITMNKQERIESFLTSHPIEWKIKGDVDFMGLTGDETFQIKCMPTTIIIDRDRRVVYSKCGAILEGESGDQFKQLINQLLN